MCFGGAGKASEVVEMADRRSWGERANSLLETVDDAKYCIADMQKAETSFWPTVNCRSVRQWKKQDRTGRKRKQTNKLNLINLKPF